MRGKGTIEFLVYGNNYIIRALNLSNSIGLEKKPDIMLIHCHRKNGLEVRMQLALFPGQDVMVELLPVMIIRELE